MTTELLVLRVTSTASVLKTGRIWSMLISILACPLGFHTITFEHSGFTKNPTKFVLPLSPVEYVIWFWGWKNALEVRSQQGHTHTCTHMHAHAHPHVYTHTHTHRLTDPTTVTLGVHVHRGLKRREESQNGVASAYLCCSKVVKLVQVADGFLAPRETVLFMNPWYRSIISLLLDCGSSTPTGMQVLAHIWRTFSLVISLWKCVPWAP